MFELEIEEEELKLEIKHIINIIIRSKSAESGPPLGTVLGNLGVNTVKFVKEFNEFTEELPDYFKVRVKIFIYVNNSFTFNVIEPTTGYILSLLRKEFINDYGNIYYVFNFTDLIKLALFKFPYMSLEKSIRIIFGSVLSSNTYVDYEQ